MDVTAHTAPSQQAVSLPLQGMEVWMNRHQIEEFGFYFQKEHDKSIPFTKTYGSPPMLPRSAPRGIEREDRLVRGPDGQRVRTRFRANLTWSYLPTRKKSSHSRLTKHSFGVDKGEGLLSYIML